MNDESKSANFRRDCAPIYPSSFFIPYFALLCLMALLSGCRRPAILPPAPRFVRIESLLPLHPAWAQAQALERITAALTPANHALVGASLPLPSPYPFMQTTPKNLAAERQKRIKDDAELYLNQLGAFLIADNAQRLTREVRARQRQADAQYRRELEAKVTELAGIAAKKTRFPERADQSAGLYCRCLRIAKPRLHRAVAAGRQSEFTASKQADRRLDRRTRRDPFRFSP